MGLPEYLMNTTQDKAGGPVAIRGYLVQTLVALLDIAQAEPPFTEITLEPAHTDEQFDFVWSNGNAAFAVQVKSTINEFQKSAVEGWAKKLEAARTNEKCSLMLVGNYHTSLAKVDKVGAVNITKKNFDLDGLLDQAAHLLAKFIEAQSLDAGTADEREMIAHSLVSRLLNYSAKRELLTRDAFIKLLTGWVKEAPRKILIVDLSHFEVAKYAPENLIGREAETKLINDAWNQSVSGETQRPHVLTFVALGGEGKTSLVAKWAADLAHDNWPGCEAVFAWSFYSQGTKEQTMASSDLFLKEALVFFGDTEMANSARHVSDKGKRLAQLVGEKRALLFLDGVEPLQYAPTSPTPGELKDHGLAVLLKGLAANSRGLCVVTTRYAIPDLKAYWQGSAPQISLKRLPKEAGVALLKSLGVNGTQNEIETLVEDVRGHALTLNLLGSYLRDAHAGDIRKRDLVKLEDADEEQGGHAFRVMDAYVQWFESSGKNEEENKKGQRALAVLRLMGLFDRPVPADCFAALLKAPVIPNLTELLVEKNEAKRNMALTRLEDAKLLTVNRDASGTLFSLDAHPLLREYFASQLCEKYSSSWREAHRRIYKHLCATTNEGDQPSLERLQPLYQAAVHGCLAGMQQEVCNKVYLGRILRQEEQYSAKKLGAFGADLGVIACFFEIPWSSVSPSLTKDYQSWLLNEAATRLSALGRLAEAVEPMRLSVEMDIKVKQWEGAAISYINLSELELTLGNVSSALVDAEKSVECANFSGRSFQMAGTRAAHADILHQAGRRPEAEARFCEAEKIQTEHQPELPLLYSTSSFLFCDLLLSAPERAAWQTILEYDNSPTHTTTLHAVSQRAVQTLGWAVQNNSSHLDIALGHLTLGRAMLYEITLIHSEIPNLQLEIGLAMDGLRRAGQQQYLPLGLLARTWLRSLEGKFTGTESAQADLDEAWEIAERGPMSLFMADIHLHRARLFFREAHYPWVSPQTDLAEARRLIEKHGYWRRKEELEDAESIILRKPQSASSVVIPASPQTAPNLMG